MSHKYLVSYRLFYTKQHTIHCGRLQTNHTAAWFTSNEVGENWRVHKIYEKGCDYGGVTQPPRSHSEYDCNQLQMLKNYIISCEIWEVHFKVRLMSVSIRRRRWFSSFKNTWIHWIYRHLSSWTPAAFTSVNSSLLTERGGSWWVCFMLYVICNLFEAESLS